MGGSLIQFRRNFHELLNFETLLHHQTFTKYVLLKQKCKDEKKTYVNIYG